MATNLPSESERPQPVAETRELAGPAPVPYATMDPGLDGGGVNLRRLLPVLLRYKWMIIAITVLGGAAGVVASRTMRPEYQAQARIWIQAPQDKQPIQGPIQPGQLLEPAGWTDLLRSYTVLDSVVINQRLYLKPQSPEHADLFAGFELAERFRPGEYRVSVSQDGREIQLTSEDGGLIETTAPGEPLGRGLGFHWAPPARAWKPGMEVRFAVVHPREVSRELSRRIAATMGEGANLLDLALTGTNAEQVAATLNAVAGRFVRVAAELKSAKLHELVRILEEQLAAQEEKLREAEIALESFRVQTITLPTERATPVAPGLQETRDPVFDNFFRMKIEQEELRRDRLAIANALTQIRDSSFSVASLEYIESVRNSAELGSALHDLTEKLASLRAMRARYTDEYLPVRELIDEIETLKSQTIPRLAWNLIDEIRRREDQIEQLIQAASNELESIPPRQLEEARLERRVSIADGLYTDVRQRYETARLAAASSLPDLVVLEEAIVPRAPFSDPRPRVIALAFLGSLALGIAGALLRDRIDPRLRYPEQVTAGLNLSILGAIPFAETRNGTLREDATTQMIEAFRELRLSIMHAYGAAGPLITTITSPGSGDGKSLISANLALAFADQGHRTLLIDGDIRRGGQHRLLGGTRKPGLTDVLMGRAPLEAAVQNTPYPALQFIGCGTRLQTGPELLGSPTMAEVMRDLRSRYSVILVDSPPLGAGVDPFILATLTGSLVMVLRTGYTDREFAGAKLDTIGRLPVRILGAVLNAVPAQGAYRYYSYLPGYESREEEGVEVSAKQLPGV
ncbi:MAG TPA: polysaccharide biosynthesis tyrosine autokinase [Longimicrobiales bacterium]